MFKHGNRFHMERLEDRQMMAGDVKAFVQNGTLFINEADGHVGGLQTVQISQLAGNKVRLLGITSPDNPMGSKINGKDFVEFQFANTLSIDANLGAGKDAVHVFGMPNQPLLGSLKINTADPSGSSNDIDVVTVNGMILTGNLDIRTGSGADIVRVQNSLVAGNLNIRAGIDTPAGLSDKDEVVVDSTRVDRSLLITTGESDDIVVVKDTNLPRADQGGHITINTSAGADTIHLGSVPVIPGLATVLEDFGPVTAAGGIHIIAGTDLQNDVDRVKMQDVFVDQHIVVELGHGNDLLDMLHASAGKSITLAGQKGNDTMNVIEVETLDGFFALMGEGDDILNMTFVKAQRMTLDGGAGTNDRLSRGQNPGIPSETIKGWEFINGKPVLQKVISPNINVATLPLLTRV